MPYIRSQKDNCNRSSALEPFRIENSSAYWDLDIKDEMKIRTGFIDVMT